MITLQGAIQKGQILLSQYLNNEWLDGTINISYFDGSKNIFADFDSLYNIINKEKKLLELYNSFP